MHNPNGESLRCVYVHVRNCDCFCKYAINKCAYKPEHVPPQSLFSIFDIRCQESIVAIYVMLNGSRLYLR